MKGWRGEAPLPLPRGSLSSLHLHCRDMAGDNRAGRDVGMAGASCGPSKARGP